MSEELQTKAPDGAENTAVDRVEGVSVEAIPYARFKEVNDARKAAEKRAADLEAAARKADEDRLAADEQWQKLAETRRQELEQLKPVAARVSEMEQALRETVASRVERLPESSRVLVPEFDDPRQTLKWLNQNEALLLKAPAPNTDAGARGDTPSRPPSLTDTERQIARLAGMTDEEYAKYRRPQGG